VAVDADTAASEVVTATTHDEQDPAGADDEVDQGQAANPGESAPARHHGLRVALTAAVLIVAALSALAGWLGLHAHESHQRAQQRAMFLEAARQGALNLTTISYTEVDADIKRILDSSTGAFYADFQKRSLPFVEVVKQAQSKSLGTITEAGLESMQGDNAQALVGVSVTTSNAGAAQPQPRVWRMRISVQNIDGTAKVSKVEFVP
jgi:Mce-associated membrane protein